MNPTIRRDCAWAFAATLALTSSARAAESPADYAASIPLSTQGGEALYRVELPVALYGAIHHPDLRDVRVFNAANELVPFALASAAPPPPAPGTSFTPPIFPVWSVPGKRADQLNVQIEQRADGSVVSIRTAGAPAQRRTEQQVLNYIVDASAIDAQLATLRPQWSAVPDNYIGTLRIEASDNLKDWRTVVPAAQLVYLSQGAARLTQDAVALPPTQAKYYRVTLGSSAPQLTSLQMEAPAARSEARRQSKTVAGRAGANPGEIEFDLGIRAPVDRIRVAVNQTNALAPVRLESQPDPRTEWRPVVATIAYRIVRDGKELASPDVPVPPNPSPKWRAVVDAASGGLGTPLPDLDVSWPARNLVFVARGAGPYTLAFGKRDALPAMLPLPTLIPGYRDRSEMSLPLAEAGALRAAPPPGPSMLPDFVGDLEPKKAGLWAALIVGVLLLAAMAWRLSRQMQKGEGGGQAGGGP